MEQDYYKVDAISNSMINTLDSELGGSPYKLRAFIQNELTVDSPSIRLGDLIHKKLLLNQEFSVCVSYPSEAIRNIVESYLSTVYFVHQGDSELQEDDTLLKIIRSFNFYPNYKDETVLKKVIAEGNDYFNFIVQNFGKEIISSETAEILSKIDSAVTSCAPYQALIYSADEIHNEKEFYFDISATDYRGEPFVYNCKSKLDQLLVDHKNKTFIVIDLKSTSHQLETMPAKIIERKYYRQLAFYIRAAQSMYPDYVCKGAYILGVETAGYFRAKLFEISEELLERGTFEYRDLLQMISFHFITGNYDYTQEELQNNGVRKITLAEYGAYSLYKMQE